jgi:curli biogenesis system outer membrane secretion channel CsgG
MKIPCFPKILTFPRFRRQSIKEKIMSINRLILAACALLAAPAAHAAPVSVTADGRGPTPERAVQAGLISALEQVTGVALKSAAALDTSLVSNGSDTQQSIQISEDYQAKIRQESGGVIREYRIISNRLEPGGEYVARLTVSVEKFTALGLGNDTRRRIAVATFATAGAQTGSTADQLRDRIAAHLVQARRFAVVDRSQDNAYTREMALLQSGDTPMAERARLGQVIGADYIVTGKLRQTAATRSDRLIELTGEVVSSFTDGSAEADFQVIEIATRQIKWAGTARISGGAALDQVSARIAHDITQTIYPMRLIRFEDPANLIVGQGGDSLHVGQRFHALVMGEMMTDPYTHEPLGQVEQDAGIVEIRRVDPKLSYARLVSGHLPAPGGTEVQIVLRPALPAAPSVRAARPQAIPDAPAITKLPFDR